MQRKDLKFLSGLVAVAFFFSAVTPSSSFSSGENNRNLATQRFEAPMEGGEWADRGKIEAVLVGVLANGKDPRAQTQPVEIRDPGTGSTVVLTFNGSPRFACFVDGREYRALVRPVAGTAENASVNDRFHIEITSKFNALLAQLQGPQEDERIRAAQELGRMGDPSAIPVLERVSGWERPLGDNGQGQTGNPVYQAIQEAIRTLRSPVTAQGESQEEDVRDEWVQVVDTLVDTVTDVLGDQTQREAALEGLLAIISKERTRIVIDSEEISPNRPVSRTAQLAAARALLDEEIIDDRITDPDQQELIGYELAAMLDQPAGKNSPATQLRLAVAAVLTWLPGYEQAGIEVIRAGLDLQQDPGVRNEAMVQTGRLPVAVQRVLLPELRIAVAQSAIDKKISEADVAYALGIIGVMVEPQQEGESQESVSRAEGATEETVAEEGAMFEQLDAVTQTLQQIDTALTDETLSYERALEQLQQVDRSLTQLKPATVRTRARYDDAIIIRSDVARMLSGRLMRAGAEGEGVLARLTDEAKQGMVAYLDAARAAKNLPPDEEQRQQIKDEALFAEAERYLDEWLDPANGVPAYIRQGVYRAMLEGRYGDILYAYGFGWRQFGTAGIRNQAVQSQYAVLLDKELNEFAASPHAPILTGPNMINAVTLLQQVAAVVRLTQELRERIVAVAQERGFDPDNLSADQLIIVAEELGLDPEFVQNVVDDTFTVTYDSRLNGEYFGQLLAAAFFEHGKKHGRQIKINLFDRASGVPAGAIVGKGASFFGELAEGTPFEGIRGSVFGFLISASHSEAEYNGFKGFVGYLKSQVDSARKKMIMTSRAEVSYDDFLMELDASAVPAEGALAAPETATEQAFERIHGIFRQNHTSLTWLGRAPDPTRDYCGAAFVPFYEIYAQYLARRSPLAPLPAEQRAQVEAAKARLPMLYTAFYGSGSTDAADYAGMLRDDFGFAAVDVVEAQTHMDGRFPGHIMPDPGVVEGWMSNLYQYLTQETGGEIRSVEEFAAALERLNGKAILGATDPDVDRAGVMLSLPAGVSGNVKDAFIAWLRYSPVWIKQDQELASRIEALLREKMADKLLLTANDAWTMMAFYKLKIMEQAGVLDQNAIYVIEKSHVTTDGLENVAAYFRARGYQVYVVNTYVGFTELAKKSRDLFAVAAAAQTAAEVTSEQRERIAQLVAELKELNGILKENVPYRGAGLRPVEEAIAAAETFLADPAAHEGHWQQVQETCRVISDMQIVCAVEESNGYGEPGRYDPVRGEVVDAHISEKDGGLALFEFAELAAYGIEIMGMSPYEMFVDMQRQIGVVMTDNQFLKYPGLSGVEEKNQAVEAFEKVFAPLLQKGLEQGPVTLFGGKYTVEEVVIYRDGKYDVTYDGYPEEGIQLILRTRNGTRAITTFRPSGTGDNNRNYNWVIGTLVPEGMNIEQYRALVDGELQELRRDFFGVFGQLSGYADLPREEFYGLMTALREGGVGRQMEIFGKVIDQPIALSPAEQQLLGAVKNYTFAAREQDFEHMEPAKREAAERALVQGLLENYVAWRAYLATDEARQGMQVSVTNGTQTLEVPMRLLKPWLSGFIGYLLVARAVSGEDDTFDIRADDETVREIGDTRRAQAQRLAPIMPQVISQYAAVQDNGESAEELADNQQAVDTYESFVSQSIDGTFTEVLGPDKEAFCLRVPLEGVSTEQIELLRALQEKADNVYIWFYSPAGIVPENVYQRYGLRTDRIRPAEVTKDNTVTLLAGRRPVSADALNALFAVDGLTVDDTLLYAIGNAAQYPVSIVEGAFVGMRLITIRRLARSGGDLSAVIAAFDAQLRTLLSSVNGPSISADDLRMLAIGAVDTVIGIVNMIIASRPAAPLNSDDTLRIFRRTKTQIEQAA